MRARAENINKYRPSVISPATARVPSAVTATRKVEKQASLFSLPLTPAHWLAGWLAAVLFQINLFKA